MFLMCVCMLSEALYYRDFVISQDLQVKDGLIIKKLSARLTQPTRTILVWESPWLPAVCGL